MSGESRYFECAGREIHCTLWGAEHAPAVIAPENDFIASCR